MPARFAVLFGTAAVVALAAAAAEPDAAAAPPTPPQATLLAAVENWRTFRAEPPVGLDLRGKDPILGKIETTAQDAFGEIDSIVEQIADLASSDALDPVELQALGGELARLHTEIVKVQASLREVENDHLQRVWADRPDTAEADPAIAQVGWLTNDPETWQAWRSLEALTRGDAEQRARAAALAERIEKARRDRVTVVHVTRGEALAKRRVEVQEEFAAALAAIVDADPERTPAGAAAAPPTAAIPTATPFVDTSAFRGYIHQSRLAVERLARELHLRAPSPE